MFENCFDLNARVFVCFLKPFFGCFETSSGNRVGIRADEWVSVGVLTTATRLYVRRVASMLPGPDVSSPQLGDKHQGYIDLLHPICDVRFSGPSNGDATTGRRGTFHPSTAHVTPSVGLMGRIPV